MWEKISHLALRMFSLEPRFSMWASPMLVMRATSGSTMPLRYSISPKWFIPISSTQSSCWRLSRSRVRGRPTSLLKLPSVLRTLNFSPSTAATMSFVVVLPTLPVTPTKGILNFCL